MEIINRKLEGEALIEFDANINEVFDYLNKAKPDLSNYQLIGLIRKIVDNRDRLGTITSHGFPILMCGWEAPKKSATLCLEFMINLSTMNLFETAEEFNNLLIDTIKLQNSDI